MKKAHLVQAFAYAESFDQRYAECIRVARVVLYATSPSNLHYDLDPPQPSAVDDPEEPYECMSEGAMPLSVARAHRVEYVGGSRPERGAPRRAGTRCRDDGEPIPFVLPVVGPGGALAAVFTVRRPCAEIGGIAVARGVQNSRIADGMFQ